MHILQQFPVLPNGRTAGDCFVLSSFLVKGRWLLIKDLIPMACLDLFDPSHFFIELCDTKCDPHTAGPGPCTFGPSCLPEPSLGPGLLGKAPYWGIMHLVFFGRKAHPLSRVYVSPCWPMWPCGLPGKHRLAARSPLKEPHVSNFQNWPQPPHILWPPPPHVFLAVTKHIHLLLSDTSFLCIYLDTFTCFMTCKKNVARDTTCYCA